jgi:hypothetical protein
MAFNTKSMNQEPRQGEQDPRGEIRYDDNGVGYWYNFKEQKTTPKKK